MHAFPEWFGLLFSPITWVIAGAIIVGIVVAIIKKIKND